MKKIKAEYIWLDGVKPTPTLRSKTKILPAAVKALEEIPGWGFDGSSTEQATGVSTLAQFLNYYFHSLSVPVAARRFKPHIFE